MTGVVFKTVHCMSIVGTSDCGCIYNIGQQEGKHIVNFFLFDLMLFIWRFAYGADIRITQSKDDLEYELNQVRGKKDVLFLSEFALGSKGNLVDNNSPRIKFLNKALKLAGKYPVHRIQHYFIIFYWIANMKNCCFFFG